MQPNESFSKTFVLIYFCITELVVMWGFRLRGVFGLERGPIAFSVIGPRCSTVGPPQVTASCNHCESETT